MLIPLSDVMPPRVTPWATWTLIALNVVVALTGIVGASWLSLAGNVGALWLFGENLESRLGRVRFVAVDLLCGAAAVGIAAWAAPVSSAAWSVAGASGAVAGLLGGYLALFPYSRILVLVYLIAYVDVVEVPATFFLGAWFIVQAAGAMAPLAVDTLPDGAAFAANLGAFVFGMGIVRTVTPRMRWDYRMPLRRKSRDTRDNSITSVSNS